MITVNCDMLNKQITDLRNNINEYSDIVDSLFINYKNSCISWRDGNADYFNNDLIKEKTETIDFISSIKDVIDLFEKIYLYYNSIGTTINVELNSSKNSIRLLNECIEYNNKLISNIASYDGETLSRLATSKKELENVSGKINKYYKSVETYENDIKDFLKKITIIEISDYKFDFIHNTAINNYLNLDDIKKDIALIDNYVSEEEKKLSFIMDLFNDAKTYYKSDNSGMIEQLINDLQKATNKIISKKSIYRSVLDRAIDEYNTGVLTSSSIISGGEL